MKVSKELRESIFNIIFQGKADGLSSDELTMLVVKAVEKEPDEIKLNNQFQDQFIELLHKCKI